MRVKVCLLEANRAVIHFDQKMPDLYGPRPGRVRIHDEIRYAPIRAMEDGWGEDEEPEDELSEVLGGVHGLVAFSYENFSLFILKGDVFNWSEIIPRVVSSVCYNFGDPDVDLSSEDADLIFGFDASECDRYTDVDVEEALMSIPT